MALQLAVGLGVDVGQGERDGAREVGGRVEQAVVSVAVQVDCVVRENDAQGAAEEILRVDGVGAREGEPCC